MYYYGKCYDNCYRWMKTLPAGAKKHLIVHGFVYNPKHGHHEHAWIETTITEEAVDYFTGEKTLVYTPYCYDVYKDRWVPKSVFYSRLKVKKPIRYSLKKAEQLVLRYGTTGPWVKRKGNDFADFGGE